MIEEFRLHLKSKRYKKAAQIYWDSAYLYQTMFNNLLKLYKCEEEVFALIMDMSGDYIDQI